MEQETYDDVQNNWMIYMAATWALERRGNQYPTDEEIRAEIKRRFEQEKAQ